MASERFQFHYVRTAPGSISGPSFVQQTEDAINDLGDYAYRINGVAAEAIRIAGLANQNSETALSNSQNAISTANSALTQVTTLTVTVNSFDSRIQAAESNSSTAVTNASNAVSTANSALSTAQNAVATANNAVSIAEGAKTTAQEAVEAAGQNKNAVTFVPQSLTDEQKAQAVANIGALSQEVMAQAILDAFTLFNEENGFE